MPRFFAPADEAADWQCLLAKPKLHWKTGYSARSLAYSWTEARGSATRRPSQSVEQDIKPFTKFLANLVCDNLEGKPGPKVPAE